MKDIELFENIKNNDRSAFDLLFKKYYVPLVSYIKSFSHDAQIAEDIVQQVFMNLWLNRHTVTITKTVKGYLFWVSYTSHIDLYRKTKRRTNLLAELQHKAIVEAFPEEKDIMDFKINKLRKLMETLPPVCKEVLELNKISGLKYSEIALKLNISKKTVESHMRNAFMKIRKGFEEDNIIMFFVTKLFSFRS